MKRNHLKKNKVKKSSLVTTKERLSQFQRKFPYKFRQVFDLYQKGRRELRAGTVQEAKVSFEKALSIYQEYIPVQNQLALTYGMLGNYKEALQFAKMVLKLDDKNVFAFLQGAISLYKLGREKEAGAYAKSALIAFHEREGQDPYNDYDMLQKLVEMLSILRQDTILSNLYKGRHAQLSPLSLYCVALALSNQGFTDEAISALQRINEGSENSDKGKFLRTGIELLVNEKLPIPKLYSEDEISIKQVEAISSLFSDEEQKRQAGLTFLKKSHNNWSLEVTKALLKSDVLEVSIKKSLLAILANWIGTKQKVEVCLEKKKYEISLNKLEKVDEILSEIVVHNQTPSKISEKSNREKPSSIKKKDFIPILDGYTKENLILALKMSEIRGYSKLNKKALIELIVKEIIEKEPTSLDTTELSRFQKVIDLMS